MIWDLEVLRQTSVAAVVQTSTILQEKAADAFHQFVDLTQAECNCRNLSTCASCLVSLMSDNESYSDSEPPNLESLNLENNEIYDEPESKDDLHAETFKVKGSIQEEW